MKSTLILFTFSIGIIILSVLWWFNIISEPIVGIGSAILVALGYYFQFPRDSEKQKRKKNGVSITQFHNGKGDNIAGDKIQLRK